MANVVKYTTSTETLSLKKGNLYLGVGDVDKGPTASTGFWNGITPPTSGYTVYVGRNSNDPSIFVANNDSELIQVGNGNIGLIKNFAKPLNEWAVIRSVLTEITDGSISPPYSGAKVWSCEIDTSLYVDTLHRIWTSGSQNGIVGNLGQGFYRYYLWARGKSTNTDAAWVQIDISDGKSSTQTTIGKNENWSLIEVWDSTSGNYNSDKFFDIAFNNTSGDTFYISSIVIAASDTSDTNKLGMISYNPGYINYLQSIRPSFPTVVDFFTYASKYNDIVISNSDYPLTITSGLTFNLDASFVPSFPQSGTTWFDLSLSGNNGTLTNGPSFSPVGNGCIDFDGTDDWIQISTYTFGNKNWTVTAIINADAFGSYNIISNSSGGPVTNAFGVSNSKIFYRNYDGAWKDHSGNSTLSTGRWYYLTWINYSGATDSAGTMQMFVNSISDSDIFNSYTANGGPCNAIGRNWFQYYNGRIAKVQFYNRALSSSELYQNYYQSNIVTNDLVLYADAGNIISYVSGSTSWYNLANSGLTGTLTNGPTYSTDGGGGIVFDGSNDYVNIPFDASKMDFSAAQTICMWIKPNEGSNTSRRNPYNQAYGGSGTLTYEPSGVINYYFGTHGGNSTPYVGRTSNFTVAANELAFITVTRDQATNICVWYKNGGNPGTSNAGGYTSTANGTSPILIGSGYAGSFLGNIYQFMIYNRALTAVEVAQNYNTTKSRFGL
jgi:hypothetical protein